jgi:hypothetical protein
MGKAAAALTRSSKRLSTIPEQGVKFGTAAVRRAGVAAIANAYGPDRTPSGVRNARPLTIKTTIRTSGNLVVGHAMAGPATQRAPWFWAAGTTPGVGGARGSRRSYRGYHPGTPSRISWPATVASVEKPIRDEFRRLFDRALDT